MRIYISADMEGVTHPQDVIPGRSQYERFRRLVTADVNAAIEGASQAGATAFQMFIGVMRLSRSDPDYG